MSRFLTGLNPEQRRAVEHGSGPLPVHRRPSTVRGRVPPHVGWMYSLLVLAAAHPAKAHPDFSRPLQTVRTSIGGELWLSLGYTDGIFGSDPIRLEARDAAGRMVFASDHGINLVLRCPAADDCVAYRFAGQLRVLPVEVLRLERGTFVVDASHWSALRGVLAHVLANGIWFAVWTTFFVALALVFAYGWHRNRQGDDAPGVVAMGVATLVGSFGALLLVGFATFSLTLLAAIVGLVMIGTTGWRRRWPATQSLR